MWDEGKRARFQALRQGEDEGTLTQPEQAELAVLIQEVESDEMATLQASARREEAECLRLEAQNAALEALIRREERVLSRLKRVLAEANAERHAIEEEKARILSDGVPSVAPSG
jgi:ATPase subunit of ABC transporter with duplicated ATPase domains